MKRLGRALGAALLAAAFIVSPSVVYGATDADDDPGDIVVTVPESGPATGTPIRNAQFRWGLNAESGAGAYAGGCNFLSAGKAGDTGRGGVVWTESHGLYRASSGAVRIEKPSSTGEYDVATFAGRCLDPAGTPVSSASVTSTSGNQVVIDRGTGVQAADGSLEIRWTGSFTVVFYGGMTYWSASDPVLVVDAAGNGRVTATASGFGASMEDLSKWDALPEREIVLAELRGVDTDAEGGFSTTPQYLGVRVSGAGQAGRDTSNQAFWGSFPASFVEYQKLTGQAGYWLTTGGLRDRAKPASAMYVSYDASAPVAVAPTPVDQGSSDDPQNLIRTRPASAIPVAEVPATVPMYPLADASTAMPQGEGLVPALAGGLQSPVVVPLLGSAAALGIAIVAVLNLMQVLPWQRPGL